MTKLLFSCLLGLVLAGNVRSQEIPDPCLDFTIFAWVDPNHGFDPVEPLLAAPPLNQETLLTQGLNDPTQPYKTLQQAIDAVYWGLVQGYTAGSNAQGVVYALPGLYGEHPGGSGDVLPIKMRDRVHVQGLGARRCIVRGYDGQDKFGILWPTAPDCEPPPPPAPCVAVSHPPHSPGLSAPDTKVLFDCRYLTAAAPFPMVAPGAFQPPWFVGMPYIDTVERIDGFTFEGGDMQVLFANFEGLNYELSAQISNCLFDMRDNWTVPLPDPPSGTMTISGPHFGIAMVKDWDEEFQTYYEQNILIASNTFIMAEHRGTVLTSKALDDAVAVIDYNDPNCNLPPGPGQGNRDPIETIRGIGRPLLVNNLFRTWAGGGSTVQMAMLGLDRLDTWVGANTSPATPPPLAAMVDSNAFAPGRVVTAPTPAPSSDFGSNCVFWSVPYVTTVSTMTTKGTAINGTTPATSEPMTAVPLWYGTPGATQFDPGFVGEYLSDPAGGNVTTRPRDWRLMPESPVIDAGFAPAPGEFMWTAHTPAARRYEDSECRFVQAFLWDGEEYGNPRVVGDRADIGFDEFHLFVMAGSYANDTNSHNFPSPLNTSSTPAVSTRFMILPQLPTIPPGSSVEVKGAWAHPSTPYAAWNQPPATMPTAILKPDPLPAYFNTRYIRWNNPGPVTKNPASGSPPPWTYTLSTTSPWNNLASPSPNFQHRFHQVLQVDVEPTAPPPPLSIDLFLYFNTQVEVTFPDTTILWSNLQPEYR